MRLRMADRTTATIWGALGAVAATAAVASYLQALIVVQAADGPTRVSYFVAALADPTILASSVNILDAREHDKEWPWLSVVSLLAGLFVTGYANVMAGHPHDVPPWLVRLWPAVAVAMTIEALIDFKRRRALRIARRVTGKDVPCPHQLPATLADAVRVAHAHARDCERAPLTYIELGEAFDMDRRKVAEHVKAGAAAPEVSLNGSTPGG